MSNPNNKTAQKTSSTSSSSTNKSPEQMNMSFSQTNSWTNGKISYYYVYILYRYIRSMYSVHIETCCAQSFWPSIAPFFHISLKLIRLCVLFVCIFHTFFSHIKFYLSMLNCTFPYIDLISSIFL